VGDMIVYNQVGGHHCRRRAPGIRGIPRRSHPRKRVNSGGWAAFFGITGLLLLVTGLHTTLTWPFGGGGFEYANIAFGQPAAGFGALLLLAAVYLWRHRAMFAGDVEPDESVVTDPPGGS
jgi:hypothetical protein